MKNINYPSKEVKTLLFHIIGYTGSDLTQVSGHDAHKSIWKWLL